MKELRALLDNLIDDKIRKRGYLYFLKGAVTDLKSSAHKAVASVKGSNLYDVEIEFDNKKFPIQTFCSCAYNSKGICKHIVAVLYKLKENNFFDTGDISFSNGINLNHEISISINKGTSSNDRKQWLKEIEQKKEAAKFEEFKGQISNLIKHDIRKNGDIKYKIAYVIQPKGYRTILFAIKQRLKKDGINTPAELLQSTNFFNLPPLPLQEKLIIDRLSKNYGEYSIDLVSTEEYGSNLKEHLNDANLFNEILAFLSDRTVYLSTGYAEPGKRIHIQKEEGSAGLLFNDDGENICISLQINFNNEKLKPGKDIIPILDNPLWVLVDNKIFRVSNLNYGQFYNFYHNLNKISIPKVYLEYFEQNLLPQLSKNLPIYSDKYIVEEISSVPIKRIYFDEVDSELKIILKFAYGEHELNYDENGTASSFFKDKKLIRIVRDKITEKTAYSEIQQFHVKELEKGIFAPRGNPINFLFDALTFLREMGFEIYGDTNLSKFKVNTSTPSFSFSVSSSIDWFDVKAEICFDGTSISFNALLEAIKHKREYVQLKDGSIGIIPQKWINKFKSAFSFGEIIRKQDEFDQASLRFSKLQANAIDQLINEAAAAETDDSYKEHVIRLNSFNNIRTMNVPESFQNVLRPYQKFGFDWLYFLKDYKFGGILADDMGLGKTIQVLALLLKEKENGKALPDIVVAPTSVVFNWINEAKRFSPDLKMLNHTGINRIKEDILHFENYDVILTNYHILLRDIELFSEIRFNYLILDESQKIKNPFAKTARLVKTIKAEHRLCLTGTPVENNLLELWSQMSFLNPGMLGSMKKFEDAFIKPIQKENDNSAAEYLKKTIYPFILRRKKEIVARELPDKTIMIHYCEMEPQQQKIYNIWKESIRKEIINEIEEKGIKRSGFKVIEGLLRLRQICNHPLLVKGNYKCKSGKFEEFKEQLDSVLEGNHKVLVFSQFVKMLEIIKEYLNQKNIVYEYLTGSTIDRESCVKNFQEDENIKIFLISLKAGGFGLNLTAADYVFHYDPWWNPAVEAQATDRTHRIGQDKNVFVYKFITKDSVEEKILQLQEKKKELFENTISSEVGVLKTLTKEDINILFS